MKERPILFSAPMVRAILAGSKTQTRRVVKPQPSPRHEWAGWCASSTTKADEGKAVWAVGRSPLLVDPHRVRCPYGQPGDRLWVRETWGMHDQGFDTAEESGFVVYRADENRPEPRRWRPSIHMFRADSRITLEVTGVRAERLQAISELDAIAEGLHTVSIGSGYPDRYSAGPSTWVDIVEQQSASYEDPCNAYRDLWESINGFGSWKANPWVWVVEFKRVGGEA